MSTMTPVRANLDLASWQEGRVPPDVKQAVAFIYFCTKSGQKCSWTDIADFMGWKCPRSEIRPKMKRLRRWGVRWDINQAGSTRVDKKVWPFIEAEMARNRA